MRLVILRWVFLTAGMAASTLYGLAQTKGHEVMPGALFVGESLTYEGKLNKIIRGITIAEVTFTASAGPEANQLLIKTEAVSKGTLIKLFGFSFLQQYESLVDLTDFRILRTTKHDVQKERVRNSEALFDYTNKRVTYVETDPKDRNRAPRRIASEIGSAMNDMISAIYALRLKTFAVDKKFEFLVSDSGLVYKVPVAVMGREKQKTVLGNVWCFRLQPGLFGVGQLIEQRGKMEIWVTDDERHIPVRAQVNTDFGKVYIKLKSLPKPS